MIKFASDTLLPFISKDKLEDASTEFLQKYCPEALVTPMPIPIEEIIETKMNLKIVYKNKISKDNSVFGLIAFRDGIIPLYDKDYDEYIDCMIEARSIIVDTSSNNAGQINNTLAHEAVHYNFHRRYFLRNQRDSVAIKCNLEKEIEDSNLKLIEWQAKNIAPKILMPLNMVKQKANEFLNGPRSVITIGGHTFDFTVSSAISRIADFFHVSIISAYYRLKDLGYDVSDFDKDAKDIYTYYSDTNIKKVTDTKISFDKVYEIYCCNKEFRHVIDSGAFKYVDDELVFKKDDVQIKLSFTHTSKVVSSRTAFFKSTSTGNKTYIPSDDVAIAISLYQKEEERANGNSMSFNQECRKIIENKGWDYNDFWTATGLSKNIFSQIKNEDESHFQPYIVLAILVGLELGINKSEQLYNKAGYYFKDNSEGRAQKIVLSTHLSIDDANDFLVSLGFNKITERPRKK